MVSYLPSIMWEALYHLHFGHCNNTMFLMTYMDKVFVKCILDLLSSISSVTEFMNLSVISSKNHPLSSLWC